MNTAKWFLTGAALGVYIVFPPYRYWVLGAYMAYKIAGRSNSVKLRTVKKYSQMKGD